MAMTNLGLAGIFNNMYTDIEYGGLQSVLGRSSGPVQNWKEVFTAWLHSPGKIEQERCDRAERMIRQAIGNS